MRVLVAAFLVFSVVVEAKLRGNAAIKNETAAVPGLKQLRVVPLEERKLQLVGYGGTPDSSFIPLKECEGGKNIVLFLGDFCSFRDLHY